MMGAIAEQLVEETPCRGGGRPRHAGNVKAGVKENRRQWYERGLSAEVNAACNRFFAERDMPLREYAFNPDTGKGVK